MRYRVGLCNEVSNKQTVRIHNKIALRAHAMYAASTVL